VPASIVIVPPLRAPDGVLAGLPEVVAEELQAARTPTAPQSKAVPSGLRYLFI
jgi:hypothetical protein